MQSEILFDVSFFDRIKKEYFELQESQLSLKELLSPEIASEIFYRKFAPHPQSKDLKKDIQSFGEEHNMSLPNFQEYINFSLLFYPRGSYDEVLCIAKNNFFDFYLNDTLGRDIFKFLSKEEQEKATMFINNISGLDETLSGIVNPDSLELLFIELLSEVKNNSPEDWFLQFLKAYCYHFEITHKNCQIDSKEQIPTIDDYLEYRCHMGAFYTVLHNIEYSRKQFLDWKFLKKIQIDEKLKRLYKLMSEFAVSTNDLFSFEKEVITYESSSNLVVIFILNNPGTTLRDSIIAISKIIKNQLAEIFSLLKSIRITVDSLPDSEIKSIIEDNLFEVNRVLQLSWVWQAQSSRYKNPTSIWVETRTCESSLNK
ncbi:terpene synthase family protein [Chryseobacterium polytrichastri]|uniref:Terpene synthase family, metal binding domain n=1 Tax=Chryseobacterium polytrichastri TaxID=1302687 RepID=A0A1M6PUV7_9FLAO|nr:terpene synthase family protein [Chryseobacterium polytrichastri]SHK11640.1 hypothetical protein SAMN05444267_1001122 [Chryseobacterium polytrichastri]